MKTSTQFTLVLTLFFSVFATAVSSQQMASTEFLFESSATLEKNSVTVEIVDNPSVDLFILADLNKSGNTINLEAVEEVTYVSIFKEDEMYLSFMPVYSQKVNLTIGSFEPGTYDIHCFSENRAVPSIVKVIKE